MTVKEVLKKYYTDDVLDYEIFQWIDDGAIACDRSGDNYDYRNYARPILLSGEDVDLTTSEELYSKEVESFELMNERRYNDTLYFNCKPKANFTEWFEGVKAKSSITEDDKILIIFLKEKIMRTDYLDFWKSVHKLEKEYSDENTKYEVEIGHYLSADAGWLFVEKNGVRIGDLHLYNSESHTKEEFKEALARLTNILEND